jgi:Na+/H+-dicarboxylate symporter/ABC-type amino acid transport substrate-binding protein
MFTQVPNLMMNLKNISMPVWVLIGGTLGIGAGVFFGDYSTFLAPVGSAYVMSLQAAVYPYLISSLLAGLGRLTPATALRLLKRGWMFYVLAWGITFGAIGILAQALPSVAVPAIIDPSKTQDSWTELLTLVIPANFFADLSRNYVPAVVIFSILYGIAIQRSPSKASFLEILDLIRSASVTLWEWIVKLAPFAVFALFAETTGTLALENLPSLLLYLVLFLVGTLLLAFWILPALIAALAPVSPKAVLTEIRSGLVIAIVTTLSVTALPFILEATRKLAAACEIDDPERDDIIRTTLSVTYPLGQLGNFFVYLFMLFAVSFFRSPLQGLEQALLPLFTLLSCIGSPTSTVDAVTFLSSWLQLSDSSTQLYVEMMTVTRYGQVIVSVVGFAFLTLLVTFSYYGKLQVRLKKVLVGLVVSALVLMAVAVVALTVEKSLLPSKPDPYLFFTLDPAITQGVEASFSDAVEAEQSSDTRRQYGQSTLDRIRGSGTLRVGYHTTGSIIPFAYTNDRGELVGYDIAFAYDLARSLNVKLHFVPFEWAHLEEDLRARRFDIAMSAVFATDERLGTLSVSQPYFHSPLGLIVRSSQADRFLSQAVIASIPNLRLAFFYDPVVAPLLHNAFPTAELTIIPNYKELLYRNDFDAAIATFVQASAFATAHPSFSAVLPQGLEGSFLFVYVMPPGSDEFRRFVNSWLLLREATGFKQRMYDYWILGKQPAHTQPHWSIIRDVLHWVK